MRCTIRAFLRADQFNVRQMRRIIVRFPWIFGAIHVVLISVFFVVYYLPSSDPNHGMLFILPALADPVILLAHRLFRGLDNHEAVLVSAFFVLGTIQWWIIGYIFRSILGLFIKPNQSTDPALASGTPLAGPESRLP